MAGNGREEEAEEVAVVGAEGRLRKEEADSLERNSEGG